MLTPASDPHSQRGLCPANAEELNDLLRRCSRLEGDLLEAQASRNELGILASRYAEQLDEEAVNRGVLELALDQNKEALGSKIRELEEAFQEIGEKNQVIETQNFLLMYAWESNQNLVSSRREGELLAQLNGISDHALPKLGEGHVDKKRKFDQ